MYHKRIVCVSFDLLFNKSSVRPYKYEKRDLKKKEYARYFKKNLFFCIHKLVVKTTLEKRPMRFDTRKKVV